jgi:hypothetical protein
MSLCDVLTAQMRSAEIPEASDLYGWLIGSWHLDIPYYRVDVRDQHLTGEVHFARVLEGRAIQDVWIMPGRMYGTTLRVWDPSIQAWRVTWINPLTGSRDELIGRRNGDDLVQIGTHADGTPIRWRFTEIKADSFRWIGEALQPDGETWRLEAEFLAKRGAIQSTR